RRKVDDIYGYRLTEDEKRALCALIYYPEERLEMEIHNPQHVLTDRERDDWFRIRLHQIVDVMRAVTVKYTRSKVRKLLPKAYAYVIEELLHESS
ncbi:fructose-bisphosphatase class III, partial [Klebsiella pneumoniae]|nr:fructose-bisphosphatase class III [Klebsiella pneumoniae]